jgi:hypothetical protein
VTDNLLAIPHHLYNSHDKYRILIRWDKGKESQGDTSDKKARKLIELKTVPCNASMECECTLGIVLAFLWKDAKEMSAIN